MISDELKKHKEEAAPPPSKEEAKGVLDTLEGQLGYKLGYHHGVDDCIELAEEAESD